MKSILKKIAFISTIIISSTGVSYAAAGDLETTTTVSTDTTGTSTAGRQTVIVGLATSFSVFVNTVVGEAADTLTVTPVLTSKPAGSANVVADLTPTLTDGADLVGDDSGAPVIDYTAVGSDGDTAEISYAFTPDTAGYYVFTIGTTGVGTVNNPTVTYTFIVAEAAESAATTFSIMSSSASAVDSTTGLTSTLTYASAGLTLTAASGTPFAATDVGRSVWTDEYGMVGTIASVTSSTVVVLTAAPTASGSGTTTAMANTNRSNWWYLGTKASTVVGDGITATSIKGMTVTAGKIAALNLKFNAAANSVVANSRILVGGTVLNTAVGVTYNDQNLTLAFATPVTAGTYEAVVQYAIGGVFTAATTVSKPFTLTVTADSSMSADVSTVYLNDNAAANDAATTSATDALGATGPSTLTTEAAVIWVNVKKANGATYSGGTLYAYMTGAGMLDIDGSTPVRSESATNDGNHYIIVEGDGTTGVGTVNIYMILADGATRVDLPSKKVSFYGSVAKLEATVVQGTATSGTTNGACGGLTDCTYATLAEKPAVLIKATDASGVLVPGLTVNALPADTTIVSSSAASSASGATDYNGLGYYNASVTGGSIVGKSTTVTYSTILSTGVVISSNAVTIANAGTPKVVTWATDKATYSAGEKIVITVSAKDSAGNAAADGTYSLFAAATTLGGSFGGSVPGTSVELVGGKATYTAFAPGTAGKYNLTSGAITVGAAAGSKLTADIPVTDSKAAVLTQIDALNAKIVALNALIAKIMKKLGVK